MTVNEASPLDVASLKTAAQHLARKDRHLAKVLRRLGPPPLWKRPASFATFVRIILEQQVSLASAKSTLDRLTDGCGGKLTAARIADSGFERLQQFGITRQKSRYIFQLADDVSAGRFRIAALRNLDDDSLRRQITTRLGLGVWSADIFMLLALGRPDVLPVGDLALVKGIRELDGGDYGTSQQLLPRAERWRPYRSVATRMIWQHYLVSRGRSVP